MKKINLIYYNNGVGLTKDASILDSFLKDDFYIHHQDSFLNNCPRSDINLFLQNVDQHTITFLSNARLNILIPNLEWMSEFGMNNIKKFDFVMTKSSQCKTILDNFHKKVSYIGFSSIDRYKEEMKKTNKFLHFSGKSIQKYTELVISVFSELNLPITIVDATSRFKEKITPNINYIPHYLSEDEVNNIFNSHQTHICCSLSEGWGHYIWEALSCKSMVVVNDCSPENELLSNKEVFLVKTTQNPPVETLDFKEEEQYPLRKINYTNKIHFIETIRDIQYSTTLGEISRKKFLETNQNFKNKLLSFFSFIK